MKKLFILLFLLICIQAKLGTAYAMFAPDFGEMTVKTTVIKVGEGEEARYIPYLPIEEQPYTLVYCNGRNYYAEPLPASLEGQECIAHVVYHIKDDKKMQEFAGKLGKGNEVTKTAGYKSIVTTTVKDVAVERQKQELILQAEKDGKEFKESDLEKFEYKEPDADDGCPIFPFLTKEYKDE